MKLIIIILLVLNPLHLSWSKDLKIVTTFSVLADMVKEIGGDHVKVYALVGANGDPHIYEPTPNDSSTLAKAEIIFVNGLGLEGWIDRLIIASGYEGKIIIVSDGIKVKNIANEHEKDNFVHDPHAWTSPMNGIIYARNIQTALIDNDPSNANDYRINGERYINELKKLDNWIRQEISNITPAKRKIVTSHKSFGYLGFDYGINFLSPVGFSTESEASAKQVATLIDQIRHEEIKTIFIENSNNDQLIKQVAHETGINLGQKLYPESLSGIDGPANSYINMIKYNIMTMKTEMQHNNK